MNQKRCRTMNQKETKHIINMWQICRQTDNLRQTTSFSAVHWKFTLARGTPTFRALPRTSSLARGKHPHSAHFRLARSPYPRRSQGFGNLPESRPGFKEIPYTTTMSSMWSYGVLVNTQLGRVSHQEYEASPPLSGLGQYVVWPAETGPTNHLISN